MKAVNRALWLFLLTMTMSRLSAQPQHSPEMVVPLTDPGKPVTLKAGLVSGSITVVGYEGKDVVVSVFIDSSKDGDEDEAPRGMKRIGTVGALDIRAEEHDNKVEVHTGDEQNKITALLIKVPQNAEIIDLSTVNGGNISVSGVSGKIELENVNGSITAKDISGSVVANTVNGDVVVTFRSVDPRAAMAFSSLNGKVDVALPADSKANLKLKSGHGEMYTDFNIDVDKSQPKIETKNEAHYHEIRIDDWVFGKINGGGPEIMMQTTFGTVYLRKAK
ncbi:MAG TPA: DUF4097 family beta strand repeat-containing protein [Puia sp.]|nr:DUF4097 family beta strand repeat-containing protein [Puia sp.]